MSQTKVIIAGDIFPMPQNEELFIQGNLDALVGSEFTELIQSADYAICNLEGILTNCKKKALKSGVKLKAKPEAIKAYKDLGFQLVSMANNHCLDYGAPGFYETVAVLEQNGIAWAGAGKDDQSLVNYKKVEQNGETFIYYFVAETLFNLPGENKPGVNVYDEYRVCQELKELKKQCTYLIVLYHGGAERFEYNTPVIRERFHRMASCGADIIISQHTHAIGEEEYYNGTYCLYGQGNFLFHYTKKPGALNGNGLLLEFTFENGGFSVKKHVAKRDDPGIKYDKHYDMSGFEERSHRLAEGDSFQKEFSDYADRYVSRFLASCRGINPQDEEAEETMSGKAYGNYLKKQYTNKALLVILKYLEGEEFREYAIQGIKNLIEENAGEKS